MKQEEIKEKIRGNLKFILVRNIFNRGYENFTIKEVLIKGNGLLNANTILSNEVYDTRRKAENRWRKI